MIQRMVLGFMGGALVVLSVFLDGNTVAFSGAPSSGASWAIIGAGALAAIFSLFAIRTLMAFGAGGAAAILSAEVVDAARAGTFQVTMQLVVLVVGIVATLAATIGARDKRVAIAADKVSVMTIQEKPLTETVPTRPAESAERTTSGDSIPVTAGV